MSNRGHKNQAEYKEGKLCSKCGTTTKIVIKRKKVKQIDNVIYQLNEYYKTIRCWVCSKQYNKNNHSLKWQRKNREHLRAYQREYYKGKYAARNAKNNKRIKERYVYNDMEEIQEFYRNCPKDFHVDHIIPLNGKNVSGLHTMGNLQYLSATENLRKHNKYIIE